METQKSPLLNWPYYYYQLSNYQGKSMEELKNALICTTLELETTRLAAQEEIRKREEQLVDLQELLNKAITERDKAQENCKTLFLEKLLFQQQQQQQQQHQQQHTQQQQKQQIVHSGSSSSIIEDEPITTKKVVDSNNNNNGGNLSSSDCEESIISSPQSPPPPPPPLSALPENAVKLLPTKKALPEKGNLLQAVIKAGPLLQTLLLAGPLPQWRHPPPPLENFDIPPVKIPAASVVNQSEIIADQHDDHQEEFLINTPTSGPDNCGIVSRKRVFSYDQSAFEANKYQRVLLH